MGLFFRQKISDLVDNSGSWYFGLDWNHDLKDIEVLKMQKNLNFPLKIRRENSNWSLVSDTLALFTAFKSQSKAVNGSAFAN